jgi:bifunctional UDP-N-acetylglucosamine pyrophosphorylase/glucosamine-1-phosphate N-acetyltransferase
MLDWVLDAARSAGAERTVVVVGHDRERVTASLPPDAEWVVQERPLGTGDAVRAAEGALSGWPGDLWVLCGDVPGIGPRTLRRLAGEHAAREAACTVLTMELENPRRYGRVLRDESGRVRGIAEAADATDEELRTRELNSGTYAFGARELFATLPRLSSENAQGEYYLTDVVRLMIADGLAVAALRSDDARECMGGDTPEALEAIRAAWGR